MQNNDLSEEDKALFRQSVGPVETIRQTKGYSFPKPVRSKKSLQKPSVTEPVFNPKNGPVLPNLTAGDPISFKRSGIQNRVMTKLKRGQVHFGREIDLHGLNASEAEARLNHCLENCLESAIRYIKIIHGKGKGSTGGKPVIKNLVYEQLRADSRILAFHSARRDDGGTGALYVMLKQRRD